MRQCANPDCRYQIKDCNGFVKAGDFEEAVAGRLPWSEVRELCGKCGFRLILLDEAGKEEASRQFLIQIGYLTA